MRAENEYSKTEKSCKNTNVSKKCPKSLSDSSKNVSSFSSDSAFVLMIYPLSSNDFVAGEPYSLQLVKSTTGGVGVIWTGLEKVDSLADPRMPNASMPKCSRRYLADPRMPKPSMPKCSRRYLADPRKSQFGTEFRQEVGILGNPGES